MPWGFSSGLSHVPDVASSSSSWVPEPSPAQQLAVDVLRTGWCYIQHFDKYRSKSYGGVGGRGTGK